MTLPTVLNLDLGHWNKLHIVVVEPLGVALVEPCPASQAFYKRRRAFVPRCALLTFPGIRWTSRTIVAPVSTAGCHCAQLRHCEQCIADFKVENIIGLHFKTKIVRFELDRHLQLSHKARDGHQLKGREPLKQTLTRIGMAQSHLSSEIGRPSCAHLPRTQPQSRPMNFEVPRM